MGSTRKASKTSKMWLVRPARRRHREIRWDKPTRNANFASRASRGKRKESQKEEAGAREPGSEWDVQPRIRDACREGKPPLLRTVRIFDFWSQLPVGEWTDGYKGFFFLCRLLLYQQPLLEREMLALLRRVAWKRPLDGSKCTMYVHVHVRSRQKQIKPKEGERTSRAMAASALTCVG